MRLFNRRLFLIALISLLSISASMADGMIFVLSGATTNHDKRTGKPVLELIFSKTSREKLRTFGTENIGQKVELRVAGNLILTSVLREPLMGSTVQISDAGWTDQTVIDLAQKLSNAPNGEIELRAVPRSD
jgi:preprotein translocase subunit SecD